MFYAISHNSDPCLLSIVYAQVLMVNPSHRDSLHLLGMVLYQRGDGMTSLCKYIYLVYE